MGCTQEAEGWAGPGPAYAAGRKREWYMGTSRPYTVGTSIGSAWQAGPGPPSRSLATPRAKSPPADPPSRVRARARAPNGRPWGSTAQIALGGEPSRGKHGNLEGRAPIRQDYGEIKRQHLPEDWIRPKGISKPGTWKVPGFPNSVLKESLIYLSGF